MLMAQGWGNLFTAPDKGQILAPERNPSVFEGHASSYEAAAAFKLQECH